METGTPVEILIIGIGNAYRADDAVGLAVAKQVRENAGSGVRVLEKRGEATELMQAWEGANAVILIDAVQSGKAAGTVHRIDAQADSLPVDFLRSSTHLFSVAESIELARVLGKLPPTLIVFGIEGKSFQSSEGLSQEVAGSVDEAARKVLEEVAMMQNADSTRGEE